MNALKLGAFSLALISVSIAAPRALAWHAPTYQQAVAYCLQGDAYACSVVQAYQQSAVGYQGGFQGGYGGGYGGGSPADAWVAPEELTRGGINGVRPGPLTTYDFVR